ncbi:hypothetical protein MHTCC0001_14500 [Flavobacteriaceae bacterium MHTCC 0001]
MKNPAIFLILWVIACSVSAQKQAANWYFGENAGLKFDLDNNRVNVLYNGRLSTREGCASISDNNGDLLFYTDGVNIWNKSHDFMANGNGLYGDSSGTQSAIIVPKPEDSNIYYVFTVDNFLDRINFGLNYSIVNMSLNGGLGEVTTKNVNLLSNSSEKITAVVKDCLDNSIWVLTFASEDGTDPIYNTFHAFEVSSSGINTNSVKSTFPSLAIEDARGYLKLSPNGKRVVSANVRDGLYIYDFDTSTGQVSNQTNIQLNGKNNAVFPYGVEFSPNSELLYVNASNDFFDPDNLNRANDPLYHFSVLYQFDISTNTPQTTETILDERSLYRGALQLGPNGKIYRALSESYLGGLDGLSVIEKPNAIGTACNYQHNVINLYPTKSSQGLPPFIASFFNTQIDIIKNGESQTNLNICKNEEYPLTSVDIPGATYSWTKDGIPLPNTDFILPVSESGNYKVTINSNNGECDIIEGQAFVLVNELPVGFNHTILQCDEDGLKDGITSFNLEEALVNLTENPTDMSARFYRDAARTNIITNPTSFTNSLPNQIIYTEVYNTKTLCKVDVELTLDVSITDTSNIEIKVCDDDGSLEDGFYEFNLKEGDMAIIDGLPSNLNISYYKNYEDALIEQNKLSNLYTNTVPYNDIIYARVENDNSCYGISEVALTVNQPPQIENEALMYYCTNFFPDTITIDAGLIAGDENEYTYNWSTGATTYSIDVNTTGTYTVLVTNKETECISERYIIVDPSNPATFDTSQPFNVTDATQNNKVIVNVSGDGVYQYSLIDNEREITIPYQDSNVFENVKPGIYTVMVEDIENNCGTVEDTVAVIGFPKFFTPNNDGKNDTWQVYGVSSMFQPNSKIIIFNRYGQPIKKITPLGNGWDGMLNGQALPADDYWFSVKLQDGRVFKDHFTLKK